MEAAYNNGMYATQGDDDFDDYQIATGALKPGDVYRFGFDSSDRTAQFGLARAQKIRTPESAVVVFERGGNESYEVYLDTENHTRLRAL